MESINLSHTDVLRRLQKLDTNKSPGPDNLHPRLLKETAAIIAEPLRRNFQTSLTTRELPADCKIANITLIFKKENRSKPENYRPISLTSVVVKILERIVNDSILKHLTTNKILSPKQHGFQSGKSIETNLLESYEETTDLIDQKNPDDQLLLDFAKASQSTALQNIRYRHQSGCCRLADEFPYKAQAESSLICYRWQTN